MRVAQSPAGPPLNHKEQRSIKVSNSDSVASFCIPALAWISRVVKANYLALLGGQFFDLFKKFIFFSHVCTAIFILFTFGCAGSLLLCRPSLVAESTGLLSSCFAWASYSNSLSYCGAQALQPLGFQ